MKRRQVNVKLSLRSLALRTPHTLWCGRWKQRCAIPAGHMEPNSPVSGNLKCLEYLDLLQALRVASALKRIFKRKTLLKPL